MKYYWSPPAAKRGFSLIELIVVIGMLSIIALTGTNTIVEFQRNAVLTSAVAELASTIRTAQTNSIAGQLQKGETAADFSDSGLPYFGISYSANAYQLVRIYTTAAGAAIGPETLESHVIDSDIALTATPVLSPAVFTFARVTGLPSTAVKLTLTRPNGVKKEINVAANGLISL